MQPLQPGQMPSPEQIAAMQRQLAIDAQKAGMTVPQFIEHIKRQAAEQTRQRILAAQRAQQHQQGNGGDGHDHNGHQHGPHDHHHHHGPHGHPHGQPMPVVPGPPNPVALAVAKFLRSQNLKHRTCILNGERKDMFRGLCGR